MRVMIDQEGMAIITEAELMRCYRMALSRDKHVAHERRRLYLADTLPGIDEMLAIL